MNRVLNALLIAVLGSSFAFFSPTAGGAQSLVPSPVATFDVGTLHVDEFGHGAQTLILIPGLGSGSWAWDGTIARFSSHYTIYVLTLPGFDGRAATKESPLFAAFAGDFWKLLADRKIDKPLVIGHSLGGTLAFLLAEEHPERLRAIVAVDGLPIFPAVANATADQRLAAADKMAATLESATPAQYLAYQKQFAATIGTRDAALADTIAQHEAASDPKAVAAWLREDVGTDLRPDLAKIAVPVLEVMPYDPVAAQAMGGFTQAQSIAFYQALLPGVPNLRVVAVAPARHFAMLDQPDEFYAALARFMNSLPS